MISQLPLPNRNLDFATLYDFLAVELEPAKDLIQDTPRSNLTLITPVQPSVI